MKLHRFVGPLFCAVLLCGVALSQSTSVSGDIRGTITDPSGALLPRVVVRATDSQMGFERSAITDASGQYRFTGLPPANYELSARTPGFATGLRKALTVAVGQTAVCDFQLKLSPVEKTVEVIGNPAVLNTEEASQASIVSQSLIRDLPLNGRDYKTLAQLAGGVSNANTLAGNSDFRVIQTPQSGLSFFGSNGRGNSVTVDGGEANDDTGGVRLNVSQDAVDEFQINRSDYSAELGSASGATLNIVTKTGTNSLHGSLYSYFRNDALDARDPFAFRPALAIDPSFANFSLDATGAPVKNSLNRQQFGGTLGLPIRKDKSFLFLSYEGLRADAQDSVPLLTHSSIFAPTAGQQSIAAGLTLQGNNTQVPCLSGPVGAAVAAQLNLPPPNPVTPLPAATCAAVLSGALTVNPAASPLDAFVVNQFEKDGGLFPFPTRQHEASVRFDQHMGADDDAYVRYNFAHLTESDPEVQALVGFSRGTSVLSWDSTLQASWLHRFSSNSSNEARAQWNWYQFNVNTKDPGGPGLDVQGYGFFGRGIFLPSHTTARRYELADNVTLLRGRHSLRMGFYELIRGNKTLSDTFFAGRFEFLDLPGQLLSPCLAEPVACNLTSIPSTISTLQSWGFGLPAFYEQGFGDPQYVVNRPFTAGYFQDDWQIARNLTLNYGLRYELDSQSSPLQTYKKNFAPRIAFAWDPIGDQKTVVRGGYGIYYSPIYAQIPDVVKTLGNINGTRQIANALVTILGAPPANSAEIYGALFSKILCGQPAAGENSCITQSDLAPFVPVSNTGPLPPGTVLFFAQPNYRNPQAQQASFGIEREVGRGLSISANYVYVHTTHLPWAVDANLLPGAPVEPGPNGRPLQNWQAPACVSNPGLCFADPTHTILQNNEYASIANAVYHGGLLEIKKKFTERFTLLANYTYSKAMDDSTDFNSDYAAFNEVNLGADRSLSDFDQRHKVVVAAVVDSPWRSPLLSGFQLAPVFSYNSGHPFNLLAGADINGDNHFTNDRPAGAPRNSGIGPNYYNWDMRLSRAVKLGEQRAIRFIAEGFNLTNRTNYSRVNNVVGPAMDTPFNVHGIAGLYPNQPLAFTAALPKREVQLAVHFDF